MASRRKQRGKKAWQVANGNLPPPMQIGVTYRKKDPYCAYCHRLLEPKTSNSDLAFTLDHVKPRSMGGGRVVPCCRGCNTMKGEMHPDNWRLFTVENPKWWLTHNTKRPVKFRRKES